MSASGGVRVRGGATAEELAVVLALVSRGEPSAGAPDAAPSGYDAWRAARLAALRADRQLVR